jgi:hypothetical protein
MTPVTTTRARTSRRRMAPAEHRSSDDAQRAAAERLAQRVVQIAALNSYGRRQPPRD